MGKRHFDILLAVVVLSFMAGLVTAQPEGPTGHPTRQSPAAPAPSPDDPLAAKLAAARRELALLNAQIETALAERRQRLDRHGTTDPRVGRKMDRTMVEKIPRPDAISTNLNAMFPDISGVETWYVSRTYEGAVDVAFHPNGRLLVQSSYNSGIIKVIDLDNGRMLATAVANEKIRERMADGDSSVLHVAWAPDGKAVYTQTLRELQVIRRWRWQNDALELEWELPSNNRHPSAPPWSPDCSRIVSVTEDKMAIHDGVTGALLGSIPVSGTPEVSGWSSDGSRFLTRTAFRDVVVRDVAGFGRPVFSTSPPPDRSQVSIAALSPDGQRLALRWYEARGDTSARNPLRLLSVADGSTIATLNPPPRFDGDPSAPAEGAVFSPDSRWLVTFHHYEPARVWNGTNGTHVDALETPDHKQISELSLVLFANDKAFFLGGPLDRLGQSPALVAHVPDLRMNWNRIKCHPGTRRLYAYEWGRAALLETGDSLRQRCAAVRAPALGNPPPVQDDWRVTGIVDSTNHYHVRDAVALSGDRWLLLALAQRGNGGYSSSSPLMGMVVDATGTVTRELEGANLSIAAATTNGRFAAIGRQDGTTTLFDSDSWKVLWQLPASGIKEYREVQEIRFFAKDRLCLVADGQTVRCLQAADGKEVWRFAKRKTHPDIELGLRNHTRVAWDDSWIAVVDPDNQLHFLNPLTGKSTRSWPVPPTVLFSMSLTDDGSYAMIGTFLMDTRTGLTVDRLPSPLPGCWPGKARLVLSHQDDSSWFARVAGSGMDSYRLQNAVTCDQWRFTPDGRLAIAYRYPFTLVDTATLTVVAVFPSECGYSEGTAISPDGRRVAAWGTGSCWLWGRP